jgi:hypothetical protein
MKKALIFFLLFMVFGLQAQVIPVGFIKKGGNPLTENLLLYLDATKTASYGGTGTTWTDISGQSPSNNATLYGSPTFASGSFTFAKDKYALTSQKITTSMSSATFIAWVNPSQTQTTFAGIIISRAGYASATAGGATGLNFYNNNSIGYHWNNDAWGWDSGLKVPNSEWSMIAVSISPGSATAYLCKSSGITTAVNSVAHSGISGLNFYVGTDPLEISNRATLGKIATSTVYSTALTADNIRSIFNDQKAAFGL